VTNREIAETLGVSEENARVLKHRAFRRLRERAVAEGIRFNFGLPIDLDEHKEFDQEV
jgi:DNA-directed RNA polymerase sigma subunit (sigma70/sigma32)